MAFLAANIVFLVLIFYGPNLDHAVHVTLSPNCVVRERPALFYCAVTTNATEPNITLYATWFLDGNKQGKTKLLGNQRENLLNITISPGQMGSTLRCDILYGLTINATLRLRYCEPPMTTTLDSNATTRCGNGTGCSGYVLPGRVYRFTCRASRSCPACRFRWLMSCDAGGGPERLPCDSGLGTPQGDRNGTGSRIGLHVRPEHDGASVICRVLYPDESTVYSEESMGLVVVHAPTSVTLSVNATDWCAVDQGCTDTALVFAGLFYRFTCNASDSQPASSITWFIERLGMEPEVLAPHISHLQAVGVGDGQTSSQLIMRIQLGHNTSRIICRAKTTGIRPPKDAAIKLLVFDENSTRLSSLSFVHKVVAVAVVLVCFVAAIPCICVLIRRAKRKEPATAAKDETSRCDVPAAAGKNTLQLRQYANYQTTRKVTVFPRERLVMMEVLGSGHFGQVYKATADGIISDGVTSEVAVKILKESCSNDVIADFEKEVCIHKSLLKHPNVVSMLGYCNDKAPFYLILEYLPGGNLQRYLRDKKAAWLQKVVEGAQAACPFKLLTFTSQVACGMDYLSSMGCVHRDLASRNILLSGDLVCKLSDFGLARDVSETEQYEKTSLGLIPVRWLALESLVDNTYTTMSDVWSFGVLLWEIITLGAHPYRGMAAGDIIDSVVEGYRLPMPVHCSKQLYTVLKECWRICPSRRPTFTDLKKIIDIMIPDAMIYLEMENFVADKYF